MSEPTQEAPTATIEVAIGKYVELRDAIDRETNALKEKLAPMVKAMEGIETYFLALANSTGQTKFGTKFGTAFITTKTGVNIADKDVLWAYLMEAPGERRHLLTLSANKTAVGEYIEKNNEPPPGVNYTAIKAIQIRRA